MSMRIRARVTRPDDKTLAEQKAQLESAGLVAILDFSGYYIQAFSENCLDGLKDAIFGNWSVSFDNVSARTVRRLFCKKFLITLC